MSTFNLNLTVPSERLGSLVEILMKNFGINPNIELAEAPRKSAEPATTAPTKAARSDKGGTHAKPKRRGSGSGRWFPIDENLLPKSPQAVTTVAFLATLDDGAVFTSEDFKGIWQKNGWSTNSVGAILNRFLTLKTFERVGHGEYILTEKGKEMVARFKAVEAQARPSGGDDGPNYGSGSDEVSALETGLRDVVSHLNGGPGSPT